MNETLVRALSGLVYTCIIAGSIFLGKETFYIVFALLMVGCLLEFKKLISYKISWQYIPSLLILFYSTTFAQPLNKYIIAAIIVSLFSPFIYYLFTTKHLKEENQISKLFLCIAYIALPFSLLIKIPFINNQYHPNIIFGIFIIIWASDTFAYLTGKTFGKTKLFERISPKKTVEGAVGGLLAALLVAFIIAKYFSDLPLTHWIIIAILAVVFGTIGDLIESKFKRTANVKDSGAILPGHGGFLDRLDSIIFAAPFIFTYLYIIF